MSEWFDESYYLVSKAAQVNDLFQTTIWNALSVKEAILGAGFSSIEAHYKYHGAFEAGVNANRNFVDEHYFNAKAAQLNSVDPQRSNWTGQEVANFFKANGINPIEHYLRFGKAEGLKPVAVDGTGYDGLQKLPGDKIVDAIISEGEPSWNCSNLHGGNLLTYNFISAAPPRDDIDFGGFAMMDGNQQANTAAALAQVTAVTGIEFTQSSTGQADIHFGMANLTQNTAGICFTSWSTYSFSGYTEYSRENHVYLDNDAYHSLSPTFDKAWFEVLLHETGHAMGLKHPFEPPVTLPQNLDSDKYTVMSYTNAGDFIEFQSIDVLGLQYLYGQDGLGGTQGLGSSMA